MRVSLPVAAALLLCITVPGVALTRTHHAESTHASIRRAAAKLRHSVHPAVRHEVPAMDTERATEIQSALIKSGYMTGEPSGVWDSETSAAMQKLQSDNGWQTKIMPDSRALIKLGLGPQQDQAFAASTH